MKMETVEHFAQIALVTHLLGRQQPLKDVEIQKLTAGADEVFWRQKSNAALPMGMGRPTGNAS
jgi:hypothetical protein